MTEKTIVYQDANGIKRTMILDDEQPGFRVLTEQIVDGILAEVMALREAHKPGGDNRHIGRFPLEVYERMIHEDWDPDREKKYLNSAEAEPFRIWRGKV